MTIFSKKHKLQKSDAAPKAIAPPPAPGPYRNPRPPQSAQYLSPSPQYQANPEWARSQPSFRFKTGPILGSQSFHQLKPKRSECLTGRNNAGWGPTPNTPNVVASPAQCVNNAVDEWHQQATEYLDQGTALVDLISNKFNSVITLIDGENFSGEEQDLGMHNDSN
jgi:hypothetical protein